MRSLAPLVLAMVFPACAAAPEPPSPAPAAASPTAVRQLGSWTGTGNTTLGFVSESGSFRINWKTASQSAGEGEFLLTLRSGISGRPLKVIVSHTGSGSGSVEFGDDPRIYEFLVDSSRVEWSISVDETFAPRSP
jgi:hypothetical protein